MIVIVIMLKSVENKMICVCNLGFIWYFIVMVDVFFEVGKEFVINNDCVIILLMFSMYIMVSVNNGFISNFLIKVYVMIWWKKLSLMLDNCVFSNMSVIVIKLFVSWLRGIKIELGIWIVKDWKKIFNMSVWNIGSFRNDWIIFLIVFVVDSKLYILYE